MSVTRQKSGSHASFTGDLIQIGLSPKQACDLREGESYKAQGWEPWVRGEG